MRTRPRTHTDTARTGAAHRGTLRGLVRACHPEPTVAVTLVAGALAIATGRDAPGVLAVLAAVGTGQLSIGWANDYLDRDRDGRAGRADKPVGTGTLGARTTGAAALTAAASCIPLSLLSGPVAGIVHLLAVAAGWSYDLRLKATAFSVVPYVVAFGLLPCFVVLGLPGRVPVPWWLVAGGALLGAGAHFANVLPDLADDLGTGVRGLPHRLTANAVVGVAAALLLAASAVLAFGPGHDVPTTSWIEFGGSVLVLAAGLTRGARTRPAPRPDDTDGETAARARSRAAFRAVLVVAALDVAMVLVGGARIG